jgi:hypothetical protein
MWSMSEKIRKGCSANFNGNFPTQPLIESLEARLQFHKLLSYARPGEGKKPAIDRKKNGAS